MPLTQIYPTGHTNTRGGLLHVRRIHVDGATDEGPSHVEVQFLWTSKDGMSINDGHMRLNRYIAQLFSGPQSGMSFRRSLAITAIFL